MKGCIKFLPSRPLLIKPWPPFLALGLTIPLNIIYADETSPPVTSSKEPCAVFLWLCMSCFSWGMPPPIAIVSRPQPWAGWQTHECLPKTIPVWAQKSPVLGNPSVPGHSSLDILLVPLIKLHLPLIWLSRALDLSCNTDHSPFQIVVLFPTHTSIAI